MKLFNLLFLLAFILNALSSLSAAGISEGEELRRHLVNLAERGSEASYREIDNMLNFIENDQPIFSGENGYMKGERAIKKTIEVIGKRGDEAAYQFLDKLMRENFNNSGALGSDLWRVILRNLRVHQKHREEDILNLISDAMRANYEESNELLENKRFVFEDEVFFYFPTGDYVDVGGDVVYGKRINFVNRNDALLDCLGELGTSGASELMVRYFNNSWVGREDTFLTYMVGIDLKEKRYDTHIISVYDELFRDERHHPDTRNLIIESFFSNKPAYFAEPVDDPEKRFPQIDELDEARLLRVLALADYASTCVFLNEDNVDLVSGKRDEIIANLINIGYNRAELDNVGAQR